MEEFEETSKQNRIKALSGNSKLLVEEEKFRKQGKKKYEQITAQMLQLFQRLTHMTNLNGHDNSNAVQAFYSIGIDVKVDISWMSAMGKDLLRGGMFKDKIGLMHLNASAAPTINAAGAGRANSAKGMSNMLQASRIASVKSAATPLSPKPKNHTNMSPLRGGRSHSPPRSVFRFDENKDHSNIPSAHGQNAAKRSATRSTENNA